MANRKRNKTSGTAACTCSVCGTKDPSTVKGTKHRRCAGTQMSRIRPKHSPVSGVRGVWQ